MDFLHVPTSPDTRLVRPKSIADFLSFVPISAKIEDDSDELQGIADIATSAMMMLQGTLAISSMAVPAVSNALLYENLFYRILSFIIYTFVLPVPDFVWGTTSDSLISGAMLAMAPPPPPPSVLRTMPSPVAQTSVAPECEVEPTQRDDSRAWFLLRAVQSLTAAHVGVGLAQAYTMDLYSGLYNGLLGLLGVVNALPDRHPDRLKTYVVFAFLQGSAQALQLLSVLFMPTPFPLTLANSLIVLGPAVSFTASYFSWQYVCEMRQLNTVKGAAANQLLWAAAAYGQPTSLPPLEVRQRALARVSGGSRPGSLPVITEDPEDTASVHST